MIQIQNKPFQMDQTIQLLIDEALQESYDQQRQSLYLRNFEKDNGLVIVFTRLNEKLRKLQSLNVYDCKIRGKGIQKCLKIQCNLEHLKVLNLCRNRMGGTGIKWITKFSMPCLQKIYLHSCMIGDQGAKQLVKGKWPNLYFINLQWNNIDINGWIMVHNHEWQNLKVLYLCEWFPISSLFFVTIKKYNPILNEEFLRTNMNVRNQIFKILDQRNIHKRYY